jgi:DNA-dependent RNA polymerase auxiliary subunit epsilon
MADKSLYVDCNSAAKVVQTIEKRNRECLSGEK